jgi:hypothetical protein
MGIQRKTKALPLVFGSAFHEACEVLLGWEREGLGCDSIADAPDIAVRKAHKYLDEVFANRAVDLDMPETQIAYGIEEQKAIVEGLIRGWWAKDGERFLRDFEVLEVEREGRAVLLPEPYYNMGEGDMILMFRPDALVRDRATGDIYIVSWKTASTFGQWTINSINSDMQSMSEVFGAEQTNDVFKGTNPEYAPMKIEGVLYLFAVKSQRKMDDYLGFKTQRTPLAYAWMKAGATPEDTEWSWKYEWETEEINPKTQKPVKTKLGKGWRLVPAWENYPGGVKAWIDDLAANRIAPRHINALESIFPQSMPVSRRADEIESWRRQTVASEKRVQSAVDIVNSVMDNPEAFRIALDEQFPQQTHSCYSYNSQCQFFDICFKPAVAADPMASGLYSIRISNHPEKETSDD